MQFAEVIYALPLSITNMVTITGLGSFREVGRSAILVEGSGNFLLDYGLSVQEMQVPIRPPKKLDGMFLSHGHLDHCGMIPELYKKGWSGNVFATPTSLDLTTLLLEDSLKVQRKRGLQPFFQEFDIENFEHFSKSVKFNNTIKLKNGEVTFYNAGHVPGSSLVLLEMDGKRILYTGDIKFEDTELMKGASTNFKDIDLLICESTYGMKDHPDRNIVRKELITHIIDVVNNNGLVVLPSFSIGRSQELLQVISDLDVPIYMDGMGKKATELILQHPEAVRNPKKLKRAFGKATKIKQQWERQKLVRRPGVVITTAGMLQGGPSHFYIQKLHKREECSLYLSGFQAPGTPGRTLIETGRYVNEDLDVKPKMQILHKDWSAHAGRTSIIDFIKKISPGKIIFNHGDSCQEFAKDVTGMGFKAFAPVNGEKFNL